VDIQSENDQSSDSSGETESGRAAVGAELARARREAGLTQRELADRLDVRLSTVDRWETGAQAISFGELGSIAAALGVPAARLIGRQDASIAAELGALPTPRLETEESSAAELWPERLRGSSESTGTQSLDPLSAEQIRTSELPRSLRGYDEAATRKRLAEIASSYERMIMERDELRQRVEDLETSAAAREDYDEVVSERAELGRRVDELERIAGERDELELRVDELTTSLASRGDYESLATDRDALQRRVAELENALADRSESEEVMARALVAASRAGEDLLNEAMAEAEAIIAKASLSAEEVEREIEQQRQHFERDREELRESFERERAGILQELQQEALTSADADLQMIGRAAEEVTALLAAFANQLHVLIRPDSKGEAAEAPELLEELQPSPAADAVSHAEWESQ